MARAQACTALLLLGLLAALEGASSRNLLQQTSTQPNPQELASRAAVLKNSHGVEVHILPVGAIIQRLLLPDRNGSVADVVLGFDDADIRAYLNGTSPYFGAIVGRVANRIANATFELDGVMYDLYANDGPNTLHGGKVGFDKKIWTIGPVERTNNTQSVALMLFSPDGDEGFPGNLNVTVVYTLTEDNILVVDMHAMTDQDTPVNLAQHSYFNLGGQASGTILDHRLTMHGGDYYTPVDEHAIPTGAIDPVKGTPFDFTTPHVIGERINAVPGPAPGGYDHNWFLFGLGPDIKERVTGFMAADVPQLAITLVDSKSGRAMNVSTTAPGVQFYSGNFLNGTIRGKGGVAYPQHAALCLETQLPPNAINTPNFPNEVLRPGEEYRHVMTYKFYNV